MARDQTSHGSSGKTLAANTEKKKNVWRCTDVHGYTELNYEHGSCPEGEYYDWPKFDVVNRWIRKTWKTATSWQLITKTDEEPQLLLDNDPEVQQACCRDTYDVLTLVKEAIESRASENQEVLSKTQEVMAKGKGAFPRVLHPERAGSRSPRGETSMSTDSGTLQHPIIP